MILYSGLNHMERHEMVNAFYENRDKHMILNHELVISVGLSLQQHCQYVQSLSVAVALTILERTVNTANQMLLDVQANVCTGIRPEKRLTRPILSPISYLTAMQDFRLK